jgi:serine/threonine protein kinase
MSIQEGNTMKKTVTPELVIEGLGAFDELTELGAGTFGTTFKAVRGDDVYALKIIHVPDIEQYLWDRETTALRRIDHPNVVGFRKASSFQVDNKEYPFLECEFIDGGTVRDALTASRRPETPEQLRGFIAGMLAGVAEIHDLGIIHRDIKPENVAIRDGEWEAPVLLDFGLARILDMSTHTKYPAHMGTFQYMAPEQLKADVARTRSDLFAVGVVAYEAGTGLHPFIQGRTTLQGLYEQIQKGPLQSAIDVAPNLWTPKMWATVQRLLSFHGHQRLGAARAVRDLEEDV